MDNWLDLALAQKEKMTEYRRWLHSHPEVGFSLTQTLGYVENQLLQMGCQPKPCGKAGICTTITSGKEGKTILLRADMDALPIKEETGLPYASDSGNMHACGHDMHTAMLLGAAQLLLENKDRWQGTVKLLFQPAEEIFQGAQDAIDNGILENPEPDAAMMIHVTAAMPLKTGTVIVSPAGISAPAADYFTITVHGKGCHGSTPENGVDALLAAATILIALQEISTRELSLSQDAVLTVGTMRAGSAPNAIADCATMEGTLRTYDEKTRNQIKKRISEISQGIAAALRAEVNVTFGSGCPTLLNDPQMAHKTHKYLLDLLGPQMALSATDLMKNGQAVRGGGSEDFAYISQRVPSIMLALAAGRPEDGHRYPQHHPKVTFDENALPIGAAIFAHVAASFLNDKA